MAHVRKQIRDAITSAATGLTTTGQNVYQTRIYPLASSKLPGLAIYTKAENSSYDTIGPNRTINRELTLNVEVYAKGTSNYDNILDDVAKEVEVAISADPTLGGLAKDSMVISFSSEFNGETEQPLAFALIEITVEYLTIEGLPETAA